MKIHLQLTGDWKKAIKTLEGSRAKLRVAKKQVPRREAEFYRTKIVLGIREQAPGGRAFKPLSPFTLAVRKFLKRRSSKALIETGTLINNVRVKRVDDQTFFVGLLRTAITKAGRSLANVGYVHEFGSKPIIIKITPRMRRFLFLALKKMRGGKRFVGPGRGFMIIQIPPRPFLRPVWAKFGGKAAAEARAHAVLTSIFSGYLAKQRSTASAGGGSE